MDELVCERCLASDDWRNFFRDHGINSQCSYCKVPGVVVHVDELMEEAESRVRGEFQEDVGEFTDDDGEPVADVYDSYDLVVWLGLGGCEVNLCERIRALFSDCDWIKHDPMGPTEYEVLSGGWTRFKDIVKHSHRYTFAHHFDPGKSEFDPEHVHIGMLPRKLLEVVRENLTLLKKGTSMWRVQVISMSEASPPLPPRFTSPPLSHANQPNRMSPGGVPMFYGAEDVQTALKETVDLYDLKEKRVWGLQFETVSDFHILDIVKSYGKFAHDITQKHPTSPYYEDEFLPEFAKDLSAPIHRDGREHIEYVPTQVFTEYVRHMLSASDGAPIHGIRYTSSKDGNACFVIFADQRQCLDEPGTLDKPQLLRPLPNSLKEWKLLLSEIEPLHQH